MAKYRSRLTAAKLKVVVINVWTDISSAANVKGCLFSQMFKTLFVTHNGQMMMPTRKSPAASDAMK